MTPAVLVPATKPEDQAAATTAPGSERVRVDSVVEIDSERVRTGGATRDAIGRSTPSTGVTAGADDVQRSEWTQPPGSAWQYLARTTTAESSQRDLIAPAAAALRRVASDEGLDEVQMLEAAQLLRATAVGVQRRLPRHAALALILSDALAFTEPRRLTDRRAAVEPLALGFRYLLERLVPVEVERRVLTMLMDQGWELTPAFNAELYVQFDRDLAE